MYSRGERYRLTVHISLTDRWIFDDNCHFTIPIAKLRSIVEIGRTDNNVAIYR
jgi:hypothetical protein